MLFFHGRARSAERRMSERSSSAGRPFTSMVAATYSPFGVVLRSSASTGTPTFWAKASAGLAGRPSASKATRTGGPISSTTRSACRSATSCTRTASRRGVPSVRTAPWASPASSRPSITRRARSSRHRGKKAAGISSVPTSRSRSRRIPALLLRPGRREEREAQRLPAGEILGGAGAREVAHPQDEALALGHADRSARVERVEGVRTLEGEVVRRQRKLRLGQALALGLVGLEEAEERLGIGGLEGVGGHLHLVGAEDLAVADARRVLDLEDVLLVLQVHGDALETVGELHAHRRELDAARLLEVGELGDLHPVTPHLPAEPPGPEGGRLPVVEIGR